MPAVAATVASAVPLAHAAAADMYEVMALQAAGNTVKDTDAVQVAFVAFELDTV